MTFNIGSAKLTPAPRNNVRRDIRLEVMFILYFA